MTSKVIKKNLSVIAKEKGIHKKDKRELGAIAEKQNIKHQPKPNKA